MLALNAIVLSATELQVPRTLDQFYDESLDMDELQTRSKDQVLWRYFAELKTKKETEGSSQIDDPKVLMVPQLWLWRLDESA
jgi:hypothetical protein